MRALLPRQQAFVYQMLESGGKMTQADAALAAGYVCANVNVARVTGFRLAHDEAVIEAMHEEGLKRMHSGAILAVSVMLEIAGDASAKTADRLKAAEMIANRVGYHTKTEQTVNVVHSVDDKAMIEKIRLLATGLGLDPKRLLGSAGVTVDAEFTEIEADIKPDLATPGAAALAADTVSEISQAKLEPIDDEEAIEW